MEIAGEARVLIKVIWSRKWICLVRGEMALIEGPWIAGVRGKSIRAQGVGRVSWSILKMPRVKFRGFFVGKRGFKIEKLITLVNDE